MGGDGGAGPIVRRVNKTLPGRRAPPAFLGGASRCQLLSLFLGQRLSTRPIIERYRASQTTWLPLSAPAQPTKKAHFEAAWKVCDMRRAEQKRGWELAPNGIIKVCLLKMHGSCMYFEGEPQGAGRGPLHMRQA